MDNEKTKLTAFCEHPRWGEVIQDITNSVLEYERLKGKLSENALPLEVGRFRLDRHHIDGSLQGWAFVGGLLSGSGRYNNCDLFADDVKIYEFGYVWEVPTTEHEPSTDAVHFFGTYAPVEVGEAQLVTHVTMVAWKSIFAIEEFLKAIRGILPDLERRLEEQQKQEREAATSFNEYLDGASELLESE